ncbi:MAG TPA: shikimate kinase [Clostridiales bacterium]|nr:shikimate kinase [Clostridiales bacterium]
MKCGLLGRKLGHSYSPQIHALLGDYSYDLFEKERSELENFLKNGDFTGLNVTIPYKKDVIPYLSQLSPAAKKMGAVNTILRRPDGTLYGHNTDYFGFTSLVRHAGLPVAGKKVLVLGSGGASNTVTAVLTELGADAVVISRSGENNYGNLQRHEDAAVIVNATPVGMYPSTGVSPVDLKLFPQLEGVLDVIYNPARTQLLLDAEALHIPCANGLWMLVAQAKESAEYFTGTSIDDAVIANIHGNLAARMTNIILVGMPGCGKSTVGALLAEKLGRKLMDADEEIIRLAGKPIPAIFAEDGEAVFRDWETKALSRLGKQSTLVIATGGGCVTQPQNAPLLHQNGTIFWLKRDISKLPTDGRPLSQANPLDAMFAKRAPMYAAFADHAVSNDGAVEDTVAAILSIMEEPI